MVGRQKAKRGRGSGRRTISRSPAAIDDTTATAFTADIKAAIVSHTPLAPPPLPSKTKPSHQTPPRSPPSSGSSKRKFEDIAEVSWESNEDRSLPEVSFSANASIMTTSDRPSRRLRSTYTLAASIASIEKTTRTRSRRAATLERSVTRNPLSSGFSKPNDSEKLVVKSRDGRECWLCSQENTVMLETAHNVVASNRDLFLNYRDTVGIFPPNLRHLASPHNLVTLCRNCHCVYDCQQPRWIILPTNIQYFIDHELADYDARLAAASKGLVRPRTVPTAVQYASASVTNLYMPFFFEESVMPRMDPEEAAARFPRPYGGAPTTMILKAGLGINQPKIKTSKNSSLPFTTGIPATVRQQVTQLFELWDRDPPSPKKQPKSPAKTCVKDEEHPPGDETDENSQNGSKKRNPRPNPPNRKRKSPHASQPPAEEQDELADICAPTKKKARIMTSDQHDSKDDSPTSQNTSKSMTHTTGQDSQESSAAKRYNLRSQYRTPPTSPEFVVEISTKKTGTRGRPRKSDTMATNTAISKRKRVSTSSESVLAKKSKKIGKTAASKKDGKKPQRNIGEPKTGMVATPLTPKSGPSPASKVAANLTKQSGVKKRRAEESPVQRSFKRTAALLFADVGGPSSKVPAGVGAIKRKTGKEVSRLTQRLPPARFDESFENEDALRESDTVASNVDSLDAQSGGYDEKYDEEPDDGYASDSGSERPDKDDWAWGPSHTANDVVEACVGWFGVGTSGRISD
ncbi:hypothetical protein TWF694_010053 [Orbilia ellipsospora]|uniref:HNH nuclease domain-containing protein n=1 Tax=Orbilia ellipsospora TaxID=2528407 RepID=A0AAV9X9X7_9PEZI